MDRSWATIPVLEQKRRSLSASSSVGAVSRSRRQATPSTPVAASLCHRLRASGSQTPRTSATSLASCISGRSKPQPVPSFSAPLSAAPPPGAGANVTNKLVIQEKTPMLARAGASRVAKGVSPLAAKDVVVTMVAQAGECSSRSLSPPMARTPRTPVADAAAVAATAYTRRRSEDIQRCTRLAEFFGRRLDELQLRMALACWRQLVVQGFDRAERSHG